MILSVYACNLQQLAVFPAAAPGRNRTPLRAGQSTPCRRVNSLDLGPSVSPTTKNRPTVLETIFQQSGAGENDAEERS
jgi:hypothetical protein